MSGLRLSLCRPGATTAELLELGPLADHWNIAGLWIGDPRAGAPNSADSYVTAAAAALTSVTVDLRLGLFLSLRIEKQLVRIAEDASVVDQASGGRVELALVPPSSGRDEWLDGAARMLRAWNAWEVPGTDEVVPVIPGPAQPELPRLVVGDDSAAAALGAGRVRFVAADGDEALVPPRTLVAVELVLGDDGVRGWLAEAPLDRVLDLRERAHGAGAQEVLLLVDRPLSEADVKALATVVVPGIRAADRDVRAIATDAWTWLTEKTDLHAPSA